MAQPESTYRGQRRGFSLVELLVSISILGVLTTMGMQGFGKARQNAANSAAESNAQIVMISLDAYGAEHGNTYPDSLVAPTFLKVYVPGHSLPSNPFGKETQKMNIYPGPISSEPLWSSYVAAAKLNAVPAGINLATKIGSHLLQDPPSTVNAPGALLYRSDSNSHRYQLLAMGRSNNDIVCLVAETNSIAAPSSPIPATAAPSSPGP